MQGNLCLSNRVSPSARAHLGTRIDPAKRRIIQKSESTSTPGADQAIAKAPGIGLARSSRSNIRTMEMRRDREEVAATLEERVAEATSRTGWPPQRTNAPISICK